MSRVVARAFADAQHYLEMPRGPGEALKLDPKFTDAMSALAEFN